MAREIITTDQAPQAIGTYSQAVKVGSTVYLSGQIALDENGDPTSASIGIYEYGDDNTSTPVDFIEGNV